MSSFNKLLCVIACVLITTYSAQAREKYSHLHSDPKGQAVLMETKMREYFPEHAAEAMIAVAECESTGLLHWLPDGSLRPHSTHSSSARGVLQILIDLHGPDIERMGLDMNDIDDYMVFARHLYDTQGPQNAWKECVVQMPADILAMLD